ncbi:MAG: hypothetical protein IJP69_11590 [Synergistaceae bacterium]|nr:hypothetical protein [Synergistaceae bacterium]
MRKFNCILLSLILFTFIVVSLGGCGGSGSSSSESGGGVQQLTLLKVL